MDRSELIRAAGGDVICDLLFTNGRVVDVFSGRIMEASVAVHDGVIVGVGNYPYKKAIDLKGQFLAPGFIDPHVHIESSMAHVSQFARTVAVHGTTSVVADPHEIANVLGSEGIRYMLDSAIHQPISIYYTLPSCVPATHMETSGAVLDASKLAKFMEHPRIVALGEMMNFPGVVTGDPEVLEKLRLASRWAKPIDGHCPGLSGKGLNAYIAGGAASDHECTTLKEAQEKLSAGMYIMIRQGTGAKNLHDLLPIVNAYTAARLMWCTDDRHAHELLNDGSIDGIVREAIGAGVEPITAIRMATLSPAQYFGLHDTGAIATGRRADLVVFSDLKRPTITQVYSRGRLIAENGQMAEDIRTPPVPRAPGAMNVDLKRLDFSILSKGTRARVIGVVPDQIVTRHEIKKIREQNGLALSDTERDMIKVAVIERYSGNTSMGKGFITGLGLRHGALASSVAHDSHNIIVAGVNDGDMIGAVAKVVEMGGGMAVFCDGKPLASLALPVAGLMSTQPLAHVRDQLDILNEKSRQLGTIVSNPFMALSFMALPVIPSLKITDKGLVDVEKFELVELFLP